MSSILTWISLISPALCLIIGWRQRFTLLWLYAIVGLIIDNFGEYLRTHGYDQHWLGNIFVLSQLLLISFYYRQFIYRNNIRFYLITGLLSVGFAVSSVTNSIYVLNFIGAAILSSVYIVYGILGYLSILKNKEVVLLTETPFFWINTAMFLYGAATCILFLFVTYLRSESFALLVQIWKYFFSVINILHYIFIGVGLYKTKRVEH